MVYTLLVILIVIAALLMCVVVFVQESKGGGLASGFADSNSLLGVRKTTDFIEKATWGLAATMVVLSVATVFCLPSNNVEEQSVMENATEQAATAVPGLPQTSATQAPAQGAKQQTAQPAAQPADSAK